MAQAPIPHWLHRSSALAARVLVLAAALAVTLWVLSKLTLIVYPLIAAVFLTAVLEPVAAAIANRGVHRGIASFAALLLLAAFLGATVWLIVPAVADQLDEFDFSVQGGLDELQDWLTTGPLNVGEGEVAAATQDLVDELRSHAGSLTESALSGTLVVLEVLAGALLALVLTFFLLKDGRQISGWLVGLLPQGNREHGVEMGSRAWATLGAYLRGITTTAFIEAVLVAIVLVIIGVPLVLPIAVLTFFGAFIPFVGAITVGFLAALVTIFTEGFATALLVVIAYTAIQQLESNVLHPMIVGRSVELHPVAILLAVGTGGVLAGIPGAFLAVPLVAVCAAVLGYARDQGLVSREPVGGAA